MSHMKRQKGETMIDDVICKIVIMIVFPLAGMFLIFKDDRSALFAGLGVFALFALLMVAAGV